MRLSIPRPRSAATLRTTILVPRGRIMLSSLYTLSGGSGVLNCQVKFKRVVRGRIKLLCSDDGALDVEDAGRGAREGERLKGRPGAELVEDGGRHVAVVWRRLLVFF